MAASAVLKKVIAVVLVAACVVAAGCSGSHRNEAKIDAVDWPSDPCTVATSDQVSRALGSDVGKPESSGATYLPFGQRYCIWKAAGGSSLTIETLSDASVQATQGKRPDTTSTSASDVFQALPDGPSLSADLGVPSRWNDGVDALVGDTYVSITSALQSNDKRAHLVLLAESVVGQLRRAGGTTTSTGPG